MNRKICYASPVSSSKLDASWSQPCSAYNILQPVLADRLRDRKVANIERLQPDVIAAGNIGCITQIAAGTSIPVVHTVELIDWATGGPVPEPLRELPALIPAEAATGQGNRVP